MHIRKIAVAAGFATGAALAFAPFAQADTDPFVTLADNEITSLNSLFTTEVLLSGVPSTDISGGTTPGSFETVPLSDAPQGTPNALDYFLYGVNPTQAGIPSDPGSYELFNGALVKFDDALNVELYALENNGALIPAADADTYLIGNHISDALATGSASGAAEYFYNFGVGDLEGYFGIFPSADASAAVPAATDITSVLTGEITGFNSIFDLDAAAAGLSGDVVSGSGALPWDTIPAGDLNDTLTGLVYGLNPDNVTADPGAYDIYNGALTEFANAYNVGLYALLNDGATLPIADLFGTHGDVLAGGATTAIGDFLQLGFSDLLGYFDPSALIPAM